MVHALGQAVSLVHALGQAVSSGSHIFVTVTLTEVSATGSYNDM
jgi:hypothetical protein